MSQYEDYDKELESRYNGSDENPSDDSQKVLKGYRIIIIVLIAILGLLTFQHFRVTADIKENYRIERDTLNNQISSLISEMDEITATNDSVNNELRANIILERDKADSLMTKLRNERNINHSKLRKYEKELGTLRTVMRHYVHQLDSLNTINKELTAQNTRYRKQVAEETKRANIAEERAAEMSSQIRRGSIVKARGINLLAFNSGGSSVKRAARASQLRTDLVLSANELTEPGMRNVYVRITGPDGTVLSGGPDCMMDFEGDAISYSAMREVDYQNQDLDVSIYYRSSVELAMGEYRVDVYMDGYYIGAGELVLR